MGLGAFAGIQAQKVCAGHGNGIKRANFKDSEESNYEMTDRIDVDGKSGGTQNDFQIDNGCD